MYFFQFLIDQGTVNGVNWLLKTFKKYDEFFVLL